jgi:hypothetical protein
VQVGPKKVEVVKAGDSWKLSEPKKLPEGFEFDPAQVGSQLGVLRSLKASQVFPAKLSDAQAGLSAPAIVVQVELEGGPPQTLKLGKALPADAKAAGEHVHPPPDVYAKTSVDSLGYAVPEGLRARLAQGVELFKKQPPPPDMGGPGQMRGLESLPPEIRKQLEAQLRTRAQQQP